MSTDTQNETHTIASSLAVRRSSLALTPEQNREKAKAISVMLANLAPIYYRADFGEAQAKALFAAFVEDLSEFALQDLENAFREYRRDPANKFFPTPGNIRALTEAAMKERRLADEHRARPLPSESRPIMWWMMPRQVWKPHWRESDIPQDARAAYAARKSHPTSAPTQS